MISEELQRMGLGYIAGYQSLKSEETPKIMFITHQTKLIIHELTQRHGFRKSFDSTLRWIF